MYRLSVKIVILECPVFIYWKRGVFLLIIKLSHNGKENKKNFLKYVKKESVKRRNLYVNDSIHTIVECSEDFCKSKEFVRLLNIYKGKVLFPQNYGLKNICKEYLVDTKPYLKRAILSSLTKHICRDLCVGSTLCIIDDEFTFNKEYLELARKVRNLVIISEINLDAQKFMDYCYLNMGTYVRFKDTIRGVEWDFYVDLTGISDDGKVFVKYKDGEGILHPDSEYFIYGDEYKEFLSWGISPIDLCAAMEIKKDVEVKWKSGF